jgi:hypothetical protein
MSVKRMKASELWYKDRSEKEQMVEIRALCRRVCGTEEGAIFVTILLQDLGWNTEGETPKEIILRNFATYFLKERLGITKDPLAVISTVMSEEFKE